MPANSYLVGADFEALDVQTGKRERWVVVDIRIPEVGEHYLRSNGHVTICPHNTVKSERCVVEKYGLNIFPAPPARGETVAFRPAWRKKRDPGAADYLKAYDEA